MRPPIKILVTEDERGDQLLLQRAFGKAGLDEQVSYVSDGGQAMEFLKQVTPDNTPQILLVDLKMPGIDGFQLLEWVGRRRSLDAMRIVVLTGSDAPSDLTRALGLGANEYHLKPKDMEDLMRLATGLKRYLKTQAALAGLTSAAQ